MTTTKQSNISNRVHAPANSHKFFFFPVPFSVYCTAYRDSSIHVEHDIMLASPFQLNVVYMEENTIFVEGKNVKK